MKSGRIFLLVAIVALVAGISFNLKAVDRDMDATSGIDRKQMPVTGEYEKKYTGMDEPVGYETLWHCISRKLGRGITNAGFGALEIPITIYQDSFEEGALAGLTSGTLRGVGYFLAREFVGIFEIVTFPFPMPFTPHESKQGYGWGYGPILNPEWVITPETDPWNMVFSRTPYKNNF